jgi:GAF domain-containing protein
VGTRDLAAQLDQVRLESDTLYGVIGVIASAPDLDRVLDGVVDVLTNATRCHACFVYLRRDARLRMRAASRVYAQLVGQVEFGDDEGLAGWVVQRNRAAFIRENALEDPRTNYVAGLEEERFQSMVAVPIPSRGGAVMGVIVLHTIAPREFDEGTLNLLTHAAPLVAGAIENAQLYEDARHRVRTLTLLSALSQRIAAIDGRETLYRTATEGVRALLSADEARLYELDPDEHRLQLVAADPPDALGSASSRTRPSADGVLLELVQHRGRRDEGSLRRVREALALGAGATHVLATPLAAGEEHLGVLVAASAAAPAEDAEELLHAIANQVAVALKTAQLIERLTEESIVHELFAALERGALEDAEARARQARCDLERAHVFVEVVRARAADADPWALRAERAEVALRRLVPGTLCDADAERVRALLPLAAGGAEQELAQLDAALDALGASSGTALGRSEVLRGAAQARGGLREATDAAHVAAALSETGGARAYAQLGAYRYLVHLLADAGPRDPYVEAIRTLADYDRRRGSQLVTTLEQYLEDRRSIAETARALTVHPNTLRQRLERIQTLTGLDIASADLLSLELAIKLARLRGSSAP